MVRRAEGFFESICSTQSISAQVSNDVRVGGDLLRFHTQLFDYDRFYTFPYLLIRWSGASFDADSLTDVIVNVADRPHSFCFLIGYLDQELIFYRDDEFNGIQTHNGKLFGLRDGRLNFPNVNILKINHAAMRLQFDWADREDWLRTIPIIFQRHVINDQLVV